MHGPLYSVHPWQKIFIRHRLVCFLIILSAYFLLQKQIPILIILLASCSFAWCIYRDIQIEKQYTGDLRNRIVGARLQKDGQPPYFYKWKKEDGFRYYDPQNFDTLKVSNITASPFFHQLLYPIADLPQRVISKIWLAIEYLMLLIMIAIGLSLAKKRNQKPAVTIAASLFLYTNAWTGHISAGQLYLAIPFLALLFFYLINKSSYIVNAIFAGLCAATLLLIRPTTIIFFLPFLFIANRYAIKFKVAFVISGLLIFILAFGSHRERSYWMNYKTALSEQLKSHQGLHPAFQLNESDPRPVKWEGWDAEQIAEDASRFHYNYNNEHGNVFVFINTSLKTKIPVWLLAVFAGTFIILLLSAFFKRYPYSSSFNIRYIAILAFCLYMITDIFSPIHRFQYNASQWLFPLLLIASAYHPSRKKIYVGIIVGLVLNSINLSFMPMEKTMGEYIVFLSILIFLYTSKPALSE